MQRASTASCNDVAHSLYLATHSNNWLLTRAHHTLIMSMRRVPNVLSVSTANSRGVWCSCSTIPNLQPPLIKTHQPHPCHPCIYHNPLQIALGVLSQFVLVALPNPKHPGPCHTHTPRPYLTLAPQNPTHYPSPYPTPTLIQNRIKIRPKLPPQQLLLALLLTQLEHSRNSRQCQITKYET